MGELQKKIGEHGEKVVLNFIKKIGWSSPSDGESLQCNKPEKHQRSGASPRTTHGIDLFFSYKSKLESFAVDNVLISVKYTSKPYPSPPNTKFKEHFKDIAETVECFARSELRHQTNSEYDNLGVRKSNDAGVLFWLSGDREGEQDVVSRVNGVILDKELEFGNIQIVDNSRASFIYNSISTAERIYSEQNVYFHYAFSSSNFTDQNIEKYGKVIPFEYLTSPIIPMRIIDNNNKQKFCISSIENYNDDAMKRLLNFASDISQDFSDEFVFLFTRYDDLEDGPSVKKCIRTLGDRASSVKVTVHCSDNDFRGMINE
jgi:hypothetical protein